MAPRQGEDWNEGRTAAAIKAIESNDLDGLLALSSCFRKDLSRVVPDLRDIDLAGAVIEGSYVLEFAMLSGADLRGTRMVETNLEGAELSATRLGGARLESLSLSHTRLADIVGSTETGSEVRLIDVDLTGSVWSNVSLPYFEGSNVRANGIRFEAVALQYATIDEARLHGIEADSLDLRGSRIVESTLQFTEGRAVGFRNASLSAVDLGGSNLEASDLRCDTMRNIQANGLLLSSPRLVGLDLSSLPWTSILWRNQVLGDEPFMRSGEYAYSGRGGALQVRAAIVAYRTLEALYRNAGLKDVADGFAYNRAVLRRKTSPLLRQVPMLLFSEWPDKYGTSFGRLMAVAFGAVVLLCLCLVLWHYWTVSKGSAAWCIVYYKQNAAKTVVASEVGGALDSRLSRTGVVRIAFLAAVASLLLFADKVLNAEGILDEVAGGVPQLRGPMRRLGGAAGVVGVYLAVRGIAMLA